MSDDTFDVGFCDIQLATLNRYGELKKPAFDISDYISEISFTESIDSPLLFGEMTLLDSSGLIDNFPILGEEIFTLRYVDFFENEITQQFLIYSLSDAVPGDQQNYMYYRLQFISPQHFISTSKKVQKSYIDFTTKEMAQLIFDEFIVDETNFKNSANDIEIQDTTGTQTLVIPSLQPIQAINFLCRKSFSADDKSSNYYFFQNRDKFKMVTHEEMIRTSKPTAKAYSYDPSIAIEGPADRNRAMNNITSIFIPNRLNTITEMNTGAMISDVVEIDILNKQYIHNIFKYKDNFQNYKHLSDTVRFPHTEKFTDAFFSDENVMKSYMIFTDFEREQQRYKDITGPKVSNRYYLNSTSIEIEIYGRNDLFAGDVILLDIPQFENVVGSKDRHKSLSGYWLVQTIKHFIKGKKYTSRLTIIKDLFPGDKSGVSTIANMSEEGEV
jgi:hypothetical protein